MAELIMRHGIEAEHPDEVFGAPFARAVHTADVDRVFGIDRRLQMQAREAGVDTFVAKPLFAGSVMEEFREAFRKKNAALEKKTSHATTAIYTANMPDAPKSNYLYISRKSLFTLDINGVDDLLAVLNNKLSANASSPRKILDLLKPIIKKDQFKRLQLEVMRDYDYEAPFEKNINYTHFITAFIRKNKNCFDFVTDKERARAYFGEIIKEGDVLFDAGYTGRSESTLSSLLGFPVNAFYLHSNGDVLDQREQRFGFETKCFYPWRPNNTGIIREHVLMEYAPSVIGYDFDAEENKVVFGEFQEDVCVKWFTERLQTAALDFCRDFLVIQTRLESLYNVHWQ